MPKMHYRGDQTADFSRDTRTGLVGRVLGPNAKGQWFVIVSASYDPDSDTTYADAEAILSPEAHLRRMIQER